MSKSVAKAPNHNYNFIQYLHSLKLANGELKFGWILFNTICQDKSKCRVKSLFLFIQLFKSLWKFIFLTTSLSTFDLLEMEIINLGNMKTSFWKHLVVWLMCLLGGKYLLLTPKSFRIFTYPRHSHSHVQYYIQILWLKYCQHVLFKSFSLYEHLQKLLYWLY